MPFQKGNKLAAGNGCKIKAKKSFTRKLHAAMASNGNWEAILGQLIKQARDGQPWAIKEAISYVVIKPTDPDIAEALQALAQMRRPIGDVLVELMMDPEVRKEMSRMLAGYSVIDAPVTCQIVGGVPATEDTKCPS